MKKTFEKGLAQIKDFVHEAYWGVYVNAVDYNIRQKMWRSIGKDIGSHLGPKNFETEKTKAWERLTAAPVRVIDGQKVRVSKLLVEYSADEPGYESSQRLRTEYQRMFPDDYALYQYFSDILDKETDAHREILLAITKKINFQSKRIYLLSQEIKYNLFRFSTEYEAKYNVNLEEWDSFSITAKSNFIIWATDYLGKSFTKKYPKFAGYYVNARVLPADNFNKESVAHYASPNIEYNIEYASRPLNFVLGTIAHEFTHALQDAGKSAIPKAAVKLHEKYNKGSKILEYDDRMIEKEAYAVGENVDLGYPDEFIKFKNQRQ